MPFLRKLLRQVFEYSGTGNWIYSKHTLQWTSDSTITKQLPWSLRLFCTYANYYNKLIGTRTIVFGHGVYRLARLLGKQGIGPTQLLLKQARTVWLDLRDPGALSAIQELSHGSQLTRLVEELVADADLFVDVGANQGIFCAVANSSMPPRSWIIAIEPQPILADCIELSFSAAPERPHSVHRVVVGSEQGESLLAVPKENQGEAYLASPNSPESSLRVQSTTLDALLINVPRGVRVVVKMDIEGSELAALNGAKEFLERCGPILLIEVNPIAMLRYGYSPGDVALLLRNMGYVSWSLAATPELPNPMNHFPDNYCDIVVRRASL